MQLILRIDLNIFSLVLCIVMYTASFHVAEKETIQNRLFRLLALATSVMIVLESLTWILEGQPGEFCLVASYVVETLVFILTPVPSIFWALYASSQLFHDMHRLKMMLLAQAVPLAINAALALTSPTYGLLFTISENNVYHRGPLFWLMVVVSFLPIVYAAVFCIVNRKRASKRLIIPLLLFAVPPVIGAALQSLFYGVTLTCPSIALSLFIVHTSVQNQQFSLDHLTGVYSRRPFDNYLVDRIQASHKGRRFACIMLDIDDFKSINDRFGHIMGDEALKDAARILKSCIRTEDFLARYAGDEFVIVLDTGRPEMLEQLVDRIRQHTNAFNLDSGQPYNLSFSAGYAIYDPSLNRDGFISHVDALMYRDKYAKKGLVYPGSASPATSGA